MATENQLLEQILKALKGEGRGRSTLSGDQAQAAAQGLGFNNADAKKFAEIYKEISGEAERTLRIKEQEANLLKQIGETATKTRMELARQLVNTKEILAQKEADLRVHREALSVLQDQVKASEELGESSTEQTQALRDQAIEAQKAYDLALKQVTSERQKGEELTKQAETLDDIADGTENILGKLSLSSKGWQNSFFGKLDDLGKGDALKGMSSAFSEMGTTIAQAINPANLLGQAQMQIFDATISMIGAQDRALSSFNKATGAAGRYDAVISEVRSQTFELGVDIEGAATAVQALVEDFTAFSSMSAEAQAELAALGATFNQVGLDTREFAGFFETATKSLGMGTAEATQALLEMQAATQAIGIPISQLSSQLNATLPTLAAFGKDAKQVFLDTAAAAKTLGLQAQELTTIMSRFDTFQGAAESTSRLNAALGTNINMMEMVEAAQRGPVEQLKVLRGGLDRAGIGFENMGFFQKKMLADILTGGNVDQLGKIMSGSIADMEAAQAKMAAQEASMDKLKEAAAAAAPAVTKFVTLFQQLAIAVQPIIDLMRILVEGITSVVKALGPELTNTIVLAIGALKLLGFQTGIMTAIGTGLGAIGLGSLSATKALGLLGIAFTAVYYAIAVLSNSPVLYLLLPIVAAGMYAIATASGVLTPVLSTLGVAISGFGAMVSKSATSILAIGAALGLAGLGFKLLFESISIEKTVALGALFAATALFAPIAIPAALGVAAMGAGFLVLAGALALIKTEDLQALGTIFTGMAEMPTGGLGEIGTTLKGAVSDAQLLNGALSLMTISVAILSTAFENLTASISLFSFFSLLAFNSIISTFERLAGAGPGVIEVTRNTADLFKATAELDTTAVENASALVDATIRMAEEAKEAGGSEDVSKFLSEMTSLLRAGTTDKGGKKEDNRPIILSMGPDGRDVIAKGIIDNLMPHINKKLDIRV
jgi:hypothetical protein